MLLGQLRKKVEAARQANRHEHHDQVPGDIHRGRVHETHRVGLQDSAELRASTRGKHLVLGGHVVGIVLHISVTFIDMFL